MARRARGSGSLSDRLEFPYKDEPDMGDETELALAARDIELLTSRIDKLETSIENLVKAWEAAGTLVTFVKWAAGLGTALGVAWTALNQFLDKP
jgi:hypothetical protein